MGEIRIISMPDSPRIPPLHLRTPRNSADSIFGFDRTLMQEAAGRIGPRISDIQQAAG